MNGVLGSLPNSHRHIEPELMRRMMFDAQIMSKSSEIETKGIELLETWPNVRSLSATDEFSSDEMYRFLIHSKDIQNLVITGSEAFPGEMLKPSSEGIVMTAEMLNRMVEYYNATYEMYNFRKPFGEGTEDSIIIRVNMNKFERCRIGSEIFGSEMLYRYNTCSYILAKFITNADEVACYPGQIQYFFKHTIDLPEGAFEHNLAYVRWYKPASSRYHFSIDDDERTCNVELWNKDFYCESQDCIIPVHHILGRFVPVKYKISARQNATEYLAVNPINRKYHIR
jgi:hypothetical protein